MSDGQLFCSACGGALSDSEETPTNTAPRPTPPSRAASGSRSPEVSPTPASGSDARRTPTRSSAPGGRVEARFAPGTLLGDRYRIVGLIGRGGMGEVYRAEDLRLEQPVALKFLPAALEMDEARRERFFNEVRMARQVTHPAVCRVHDVGEVAGLHFLTMEYVDGGNLAALIRRIGRLPEAKALAIAQQIAAGLGAAHAKGVLHRDLKPENVMLDSDGNARIADFGLASLADSIEGSDVRSGTPAYMSPEQLAGREVTSRSDVYALGLVLYELFTGRRAFQGRSVAELTRQHERETPTHPSDLVPDVSPVVEDVILRCLAKDPRRRPPSAVAVEAMLAGRDALAAAIAAGETPSPEMVAAAGGGDRMRPNVAWACLGLVALGLFVAPFVLPRSELTQLTPIDKSPAVLEDRARTLLRELGHSDKETDSAKGFRLDGDYWRHIDQDETAVDKWTRLATNDPPVLHFWFRKATRPLTAHGTEGIVTWTDPPTTDSGMAGVRLDTSGRLLAFYSIPPQRETEDYRPTGATDWSQLLTAAQLDMAKLKPVAPRWTPAFFCDERAAWEGSLPGPPEVPIRVEAAAYRGRPAALQIVYPWTRPGRMQPFQFTKREIASQVIFTVLVVGLLLAGGIMARRHVVLGRGDRQGAARVAVAACVLAVANWALDAHHVADRGGEMQMTATGVSGGLLIGAIIWVFYLALEPYLRRLWPETLISWARLLAGRSGDPRVGRDVLIGVTGGMLLVAGIWAGYMLPEWVGSTPQGPRALDYEALVGLKPALARILGLPLGATLLGMASLLILTLARLLLRGPRTAVVALLVVLATFQVVSMSGPYWVRITLGTLVMSVIVWVLLRFGLLATVVVILTANVLMGSPLTWALGDWRGTPTVLALMLLGGLALWGFRTALAGQLSLPADHSSAA